ncbi:pyocin S6 family toxin immunity protein [Pseudomonas chlororaphis]|uniref:pyocin S6 family toxin immunity protein n=2 Tax=Pseudomonas chlororaphis TaxID=587753 RepID=UPI003BF5B68E
MSYDLLVVISGNVLSPTAKTCPHLDGGFFMGDVERIRPAGKELFMYLCITGFLPDEANDDSLQYELDVSPEFEQAVMEILGWQSLAAEADGELPLTKEQVRQIAMAINEALPDDLDMFIGVEAPLLGR